MKLSYSSKLTQQYIKFLLALTVFQLEVLHVPDIISRYESISEGKCQAPEQHLDAP